MPSTDDNIAAYMASSTYNLLETELETLYQVSQVLSSSLDFRTALTTVLRILNDVGNLRHGMIGLLDKANGDMLVIVLRDDPTPFATLRFGANEAFLAQF